jgi:hypothetical protein
MLFAYSAAIFSQKYPQIIPPKPIKSLYLGSITFFETIVLGLGQTENNRKKPCKGV